MANRIDLQRKLEELLQSRNVYYQPPESIKIEYPAIVYSKSNIEGVHADDAVYSLFYCYEVTVIDTKPDNDVITKLMSLEHCRFNRHYSADNLNHDVFTLYF